MGENSEAMVQEAAPSGAGGIYRLKVGSPVPKEDMARNLPPALLNQNQHKLPARVSVDAEQSLGNLKSVCEDRQLTTAEVFSPDFVPSLPPALPGFALQEGLKGLAHTWQSHTDRKRELQMTEVGTATFTVGSRYLRPFLPPCQDLVTFQPQQPV